MHKEFPYVFRKKSGLNIGRAMGEYSKNGSLRKMVCEHGKWREWLRMCPVPGFRTVPMVYAATA